MCFGSGGIFHDDKRQTTPDLGRYGKGAAAAAGQRANITAENVGTALTANVADLRQGWPVAPERPPGVRR